MNLSIVCASDDNFALPMTVAIFAASANLGKGRTADVYILDSGISEKNKQKIRAIFKNRSNIGALLFLNKNLDENNNLFATESINKTTYLRILVPDLLPALDKVIYIDGDLIVEDDLGKIWDIPFDGNLASGVRDYYFPTVSANGAIAGYQKLNLDQNLPFCNAGVIVMNLTAWRTEQIAAKVMGYCERTKQNDQQGINAILAGRWKLLDPRWNVTLSSVNALNNYPSELTTGNNSKNPTHEPAITHFTSRYKPWHLGYEKLALLNNYYFQKERNRFYHYLKESGWFTPSYFFFWLLLRKSILFWGIKVPHQIKGYLGRSTSK